MFEIFHKKKKPPKSKTLDFSNDYIQYCEYNKQWNLSGKVGLRRRTEGFARPPEGLSVTEAIGGV